MNGKKINNLSEEPTILIAPLDWGLGHATRCIPIIYALLRSGATVLLAGDGAIEHLYKKEFPLLTFLPLRGYQIKYARKKLHFNLKLLSQLPHVQRTIQYEHRWLKKVVKEYKLDGIISDNRFGLHHPGIPCVYITHQLFIETGVSLLNSLAQKIHYRFINRFSECWVPDNAGHDNLAGKLSHPQKLPAVPVHYLGCLSRFKRSVVSKSTRLLVLLSGPEPMRSIFEALICKQLKDVDGEVVLVRGLPLEQATLDLPMHVTVYNHLPAADLERVIQGSQTVLARAGYSTIMDLARLQQEAILVPTPGQGEQEYLATYLKEKNLCYSCPQQGFHLTTALAEASHFYHTAQSVSTSMQVQVVTNWLAELRRAKALQ